VIEVDAVIGVDHNLAIEGDTQEVARRRSVEDSRPAGIRKLRVQMTGAHGGLGRSIRGGAAGTGQLAVGGGADLNGADIRHHFIVVCRLR
jgi:hypothetical protein